MNANIQKGVNSVKGIGFPLVINRELERNQHLDNMTKFRISGDTFRDRSPGSRSYQHGLTPLFN